MNPHREGFIEVGLYPVGHDKNGAMYDVAGLLNGVSGLINSNDYFYKRAKMMTNDMEKAKELTDKIVDDFRVSINRLMETERMFSENTKKMSGSVRDSIDKLSNGIARVEKTANFDRLEKYVVLLERAASAMNSLAELEKSGRLEKIAVAIR